MATVCFLFYLRLVGLNFDCTTINNYAPVSNENYEIWFSGADYAVIVCNHNLSYDKLVICSLNRLTA